MEELLLTLLSRLEAVGDRNELLYDSVVRHRMGDAIFYGFVKADPAFVLPGEFNHRMSDANNRLVRDAIGEFIGRARAFALSAGLDTFHKRLAAFQNCEVRTPVQKNDTEAQFGWSDPAEFDERGDVIR